MAMHCCSAVWGPVPPALDATCTALDGDAAASCWSGASDGSITCWRPTHDADSSNSDGGSAVQPVAVLQGHAHPVVALLSGLTDGSPSASAAAAATTTSNISSSSSSSSYLVSLDAEGWVGLWDCSSWVCLDMTRAAPLPPGCKPSLLLMPDGAHVCIIIPATPNLQQEQQTLWQHQQQQQQQRQQQQQEAHQHAHAAQPAGSPQQQQQQQQQHPQQGHHPATAANLSPMMLVLRWRGLALVSAPLVSNLGLAALTSSSVTLDQADEVVACSVLDTAPPLAPAAADTVVLAVMRSGWMWAGSLAGNSLGQAWEKPLVSGGSSSPLRHSCLLATHTNITNTNSSSNSGGGGINSQPAPSDTAGSTGALQLQLQLLLVQPEGWRLFVCNSFSGSTGLPQQWQQAAQHVFLQGSLPQHSRLHSSSMGRGSRAQGAANNSSSQGTPGPQRVRFDVGVDAEGSGCRSQSSSCSSTGDSNSMSSESESGSDSDGSSESGRGGQNKGAAHTGSRLRQAAGPISKQQQRQHHQQHQLLGGTLLQPCADHNTSSAVCCDEDQPWQAVHQHASTAAAVAVVVWAADGQQQLWAVQLSHPRSTAQQQQQHEVALLQSMQLQPWPEHCSVKLMAAVGRQGGAVTLLTQHSRHLQHHHHQHHHGHEHHHNDNSSSSLPSLHDALHKWHGDWHMHCLQLTANDQQQQQHLSGGDATTSPQQVPWQLQHCQGAWGDAWRRRQAVYNSSSIEDRQGSMGQHGLDSLSSRAHGRASDGCEARDTDDPMQVDSSTDTSAPSRKRPAADEATAADSAVSVGPVGCQAVAGSGPPPASRAKQPRMLCADGVGGPGRQQQQHAAEQAGGSAALGEDGGQQQQVTHMLLLGSDAPGMHQVAVILASGTLLFYDLATYCVPGAAWHPDCCAVGLGHIGRVSTTLEVTFRCPPQQLLGCCAWGAGADGGHGGAHSSLVRPVSWHFSSSAAARADQTGGVGTSAYSSNDGSSSGDLGSRGAQAHAQHHQQQSEGGSAGLMCPAAAQGWCRRPAQGGWVQLLLTGGRDGSVRAWDLRLQHLGHTWMSVHPHTAPVEAIVLPPVSSRLPWSTCVLSVCAVGRVALSCLAAGATMRTFDGWSLGPPAQLAWSTGRGLLAAGGWDAAGVWQVAVWDTYSGHMDRRLQGAPAHMLMATLAQELTSSMRHLARTQQQTAAHTPASAAASTAGSKRTSLDVPVASSYTGTPASPAGGDGLKAGGAGTGSSSGDAGGFTPRLQLVSHSSSSGAPIKPQPFGRQDVLLLDVDVQQLVAQLEAHSKQQRRDTSSRQQQAGLSSRRSSMDVPDSSTTTSARASRASSLDLMGLVQGMVAGSDAPLPAVLGSTVCSPNQQQQAPTPRASATTLPLLHATPGSSAGVSRQGSLAANIAAAVGTGLGGHVHAGAQGPTHTEGSCGQRSPLHQRVALPPALAAALQGLCVLHKWGVEPLLDQQLVLLLQEQLGWPAHALPPTPRASSGSRPLSPASAAASPAASKLSRTADHEAWLQMQLQQLLPGPARGSPMLQESAPCLTQEVLLSPACGAAVLALPAVHAHRHSASDRSVTDPTTQGDNKSLAGHSSHAAAATGGLLLLSASPTLLASRLLVIISISKWLMASIPSATSVNSCSGLVTLYALQMPELLTQAVAAAAAAQHVQRERVHQPSLAADGVSSADSVGGSPLQPHHGRRHHPVQQQELQHREQPPVLPDLLLIASTSLACPGLLAEAAQLLMAALLHPAAPGSFMLPTLHPQLSWGAGPRLPAQLSWGAGPRLPAQQQHQQQPGEGQEEQEQQVFTSPGAAAAASCWPPAVLQLAVLHAQHQQQQPESVPQANSSGVAGAAAAPAALSLQQLPLWMPQLVLAAAASVAHATRTPPELLAAVSSGLLDVFLGCAPAHSSCVAAGWLCQVLTGSHWAVWRPYLGKPGHLAHRLCHLIDRLQASTTDSRTAASHLVMQSISSSSSGSGTSTSGSSNDFILLPQQPCAVADPVAAMQSMVSRGLSSTAANNNNSPTSSTTSSSSTNTLSGWQQWQQRHVEGGLFLSPALMGTMATRQGGSLPLSRSVSPAAMLGGGSLEVPPATAAGRLVSPAGSGGVFNSGSGGIGMAAAASTLYQQVSSGLHDHIHTTPSGLAYSYNSTQQGAASGVSAGSAGVLGTVHERQQLQQQSLLGVRASRGALVVWLRSALDVLAALTHVDPAAVLMELSHKLAGPGAESAGTSLTLLITAISRLLRRPTERPALLPHLGFITALVIQSLDPSRVLLRQTLLQPVLGVLRELSAHFPQVDCHNSSLQVAVGSTRALAGAYPGGSGGAVGGGGGGPECVQAPTVAVFDMQGGTNKKVLLLPVLLDSDPVEQQQQPQHEGAHGVSHSQAAGPGHTGRQVGPFGSTNSLHSNASSASAVDAGGGGMPPVPLVPGAAALPGLWSAAEGAGAGGAGRNSGGYGGGGGGVLGGSSSSLSSSITYDTPRDSRSSSYGRLGELQRGALASTSTMTRAEAAMVEGWFGGSTGSSADGAAAGGQPAGHRTQHSQQHQQSSSSSSMQCGVIYPDAAAASSPVLCASEVSGGVAAVAFSPAGDAVAAFVLECHCLVVWRLGASWTQRLAHLGSSRPISQMPHAYIRLPAAALLVNAVFADSKAQQQDEEHQGHKHHHHHHHRRSASGGGGEGCGSAELLQWQLRWQTDSHIDLLYQGVMCGSIEVHL